MSKPLLVMKFGGTSVGSPRAIAGAAELIAEQTSRYRTAAVVSAMSQVTNTLLATLEAGGRGDPATVEANLATLRKKHLDACRELVAPQRRETAEARIHAILDAFDRVARGILMLGERPERSEDAAVPTGEKLSALLVSEVLRQQGIDAEPADGSEAIVTDAVFGGASPLLAETTEKAQGKLMPILDRGGVPIVTGFNGATRDGIPTTLGRGGSDFSASIIASALDADELWIWTDVPGILTADPRLVADARVLAEVTYNEAAELAYNGAKVLHPRTLAPLAEKGIPVRIRNSFDPRQPGTRISHEPPGSLGVRAVTSLPKVTLLSIEAVSISLSGAQLMARALEAAARAKVEVLLLTRSSFRQNFCMLARTEEVGAVLDGLREELALELAHGYVHPIDVDHSVGLLAAVGEGMRGTPGFAGRLFAAMSENAINVIAIAQGSSELTIAIVVSEADLTKAVQAVHAQCGLGRAEPAKEQAAPA